MWRRSTALLAAARARGAVPLPLRSQRLRITPRLLSTQGGAAAAADDRNAYDVLGVQRGVDNETLRAVYKQLAVQWHPDRHQGDAKATAELRFQEVSEAKSLLSEVLGESLGS